MSLKVWSKNKSGTNPSWLIVTETVANREVGDRAYRDVLAACLNNNEPPRLPAQTQSPAAGLLFQLGALVQISYAAFMREVTDEQLMQQYLKGDVEAFDQLYARHRGPLYRYFKRQVNNVTTVNDLYQGVWEKIIRARDKYRSTTVFAVWMYAIAHNHLVDYYRRIKPDDPIQMDVLSDHQANPVQRAIDDEQNKLLHSGINALPVEQRNALLLKLETGLKIEDIAKVTGVSRETVKSRLRYAVHKLKRSLVE